MMAVEPTHVNLQSHSDNSDNEDVGYNPSKDQNINPDNDVVELLFLIRDYLKNMCLDDTILLCDTVDFTKFMSKCKACLLQPGDSCKCFPDETPTYTVFDGEFTSLRTANPRYKYWADAYEKSEETEKLVKNLYEFLSYSERQHMDFEHFLKFFAKYSKPRVL